MQTEIYKLQSETLNMTGKFRLEKNSFRASRGELMPILQFTKQLFYLKNVKKAKKKAKNSQKTYS